FRGPVVEMVDVVASAVTRARVTEAKCLLECHGHPVEVRTFGDGPGPRERIWEKLLGNEHGLRNGFGWVGGTGFLHDVVCAIDFVMPWAAVPMVAADEVE